MTTRPTEKSPKAETTTAATRAPSEPHPEKVPAEAENIEHTLRRLTAEKAEKRKKNPGLYL